MAGERKPTDDTITLVAFLFDRGWMCADEIAGRVAALGFERPSAQWIAGRLVAMCKEICPRFERRKRSRTDVAEYRVTSWAHTSLKNTWRGFCSTATAQELPSPQREGLRDAS